MIKNSGDKGLGLFADHKYEYGDIITFNSFKIISNWILRELDKETLMKCFSDGVRIVYPLGDIKYINHDANYNCGVYIGKKQIIIYALQGIKKGEEITIDYGENAKFLNIKK